MGSCADLIVENSASQWDNQDVLLTAEALAGLTIEPIQDDETEETVEVDPLLDHDYDLQQCHCK